jgi:hypothetical protein
MAQLSAIHGFEPKGRRVRIGIVTPAAGKENQLGLF